MHKDINNIMQNVIKCDNITKIYYHSGIYVMLHLIFYFIGISISR